MKNLDSREARILEWLAARREDMIELLAEQVADLVTLMQASRRREKQIHP